MALIKCPECGAEISDKAERCPKCGCPASEFKKVEHPRESRCPHCGEVVDKNEEYCPKCNMRLVKYENIPTSGVENPKKKVKPRFYQRSWFSILMLIIFFPVGLYLMWKYKKFPLAVRVVVSVFFGLMVVSSILNHSPDEDVNSFSEGLASGYSDVIKENETKKEGNEILENTVAEIEKAAERESETELMENSQDQTTESSKNNNENDIAELQNSEVQTTISSNDKLLNDLRSILSEDIANKAYDILINQIGFTNVEYIGKNPVGDSNYDFSSDKYNFMMTASDDVYRVFQSKGGFVFYEDGEVKNSVTDAESKTIDHNDRIAYYMMAKKLVESGLKSPKSAKFPSIVTRPEEITMSKKDNIVAVQSYVDADNSFGTKIRSKWLVEFSVTDISAYSCEPLYLNIDGEVLYGEYIDLN